MYAHICIIPSDAWWKRSRIRLLEDFITETGHRIPKGFECDGASIVWFVRWFISSKNRLFHAAILHDWLLEDQGWEWDLAAFEMNKEMLLRQEEVPNWLRTLAYNAILRWGKVRHLFINP